MTVFGFLCDIKPHNLRETTLSAVTVIKEGRNKQAGHWPRDSSLLLLRLSLNFERSQYPC